MEKGDWILCCAEGAGHEIRCLCTCAEGGMHREGVEGGENSIDYNDKVANMHRQLEKMGANVI